MKKYDKLSVTHTVRIDSELSTFLCTLSEQLNVSVSELIRMILSSTMAQYKRVSGGDNIENE